MWLELNSWEVLHLARSDADNEACRIVNHGNERGGGREMMVDRTILELISHLFLSLLRVNYGST